MPQGGATMTRSIEVYVGSVEVDVDLSLFSTADLVEELLTRKDGGKEAATAAAAETESVVDVIPSLSGEDAHPLHAIYYAFKFGLNDKASALARAYCCDQLGVIL